MAKIMQLDYDTGELIEIYQTATKAAQDNYMSGALLSMRLKSGNGTARFDDRQLVFTRAFTPKSF